MYARVTYTCTKQVNTRLSNPSYSLHKIVDQRFEKPGEEKTAKFENEVFEDSGISDGKYSPAPL